MILAAIIVCVIGIVIFGIFYVLDIFNEGFDKWYILFLLIVLLSTCLVFSYYEMR